MFEEADAPIIVTGMGRSGTTWMQWCLCQHPRIHVHGQSPGIHWHEFWSWYERLVECGKWARKSNRVLGYEVAHYAGSPPGRCRDVFKRMFHDYMAGNGPNKPRWGLKWGALCIEPNAVSQLESLWPQARWVVCVRDPFLTINSVKNTFDPDLDIHRFAARWVDVCAFVESHDPRRVVMVQMDKLSEQTAEARRAVMARVFTCVGERPTAETGRFLRRWPVVHKVKPDDRRTFALSEREKRALLDEVPKLGACIERLGYASSAQRDAP
jgi:hypothetical protein